MIKLEAADVPDGDLYNYPILLPVCLEILLPFLVGVCVLIQSKFTEAETAVLKTPRVPDSLADVDWKNLEAYPS